ACSDPKEAREANFATAFNQHVNEGGDKHSRLCYRMPGFDRESGSVKWTEHMASVRLPEPHVRALDRMVELGIFKEPTKTPVRAGFMANVDYSYPLVDSQSVSIVEDEATNMLGGKVPAYSLCVGKIVMSEVVEWTEPASWAGQTMSYVSYRVHYDDLPAWTSDPTVAKAFPQTNQQAAGPFVTQKMLVLTN